MVSGKKRSFVVTADLRYTKLKNVLNLTPLKIAFLNPKPVYYKSGIKNMVLRSARRTNRHSRTSSDDYYQSGRSDRCQRNCLTERT